MSKKYNLKIEFTQSTDNKADNETLISEHSDNIEIHLLKTKVFSKHLTRALDAITQELCDMGLGEAGEVNAKPKGK